MLYQKLIKKYKNNSIYLANCLIDQAEENFVYSKNEGLYLYNGKYYEPFEQIDFERYFYNFIVEYGISEQWKQNKMKEVQKAIEVNKRVPLVIMDDYDNLINFNNYILNIDNLEIYEHNKRYYFSTIVNCDSDNIKTDIPQHFFDFLCSTFREGTNEIDKDTIDLVQQIGGYLLYPKNKLKKMFLFMGGGSNGKSILLEVFKMLFDEKNISYLTLEQLSSNSFERTKLVGSRINISSESKASNLDAEEIKKIISSEGITIAAKFKPHFNYIPRTKIVIASNTRPYFNDTTYAISRRLCTISFQNKFVQETEFKKLKSPHQRNIYLAKDEDIMRAEFKQEMPEIVNWFLSGLYILRNNNWELTESINAEETKEEYLQTNDTVGTWLYENYEATEDANDWTEITMILQDYREWYSGHVSTKILNFSSISLGLKIKDIFGVKSKQIRLYDGKYARVYPVHKKQYETIETLSTVDKYILGIDDNHSEQLTLQ